MTGFTHFFSLGNLALPPDRGNAATGSSGGSSTGSLTAGSSEGVDLAATVSANPVPDCTGAGLANLAASLPLTSSVGATATGAGVSLTVRSSGGDAGMSGTSAWSDKSLTLISCSLAGATGAALGLSGTVLSANATDGATPGLASFVSGFEPFFKSLSLTIFNPLQLSEPKNRYTFLLPQ